MIRTINLLFLLIIYLAYAGNCRKVESQKMNHPNMKTIYFSDLKTADQISGDISAFSAILNIPETQSASQGGINFELCLQYEGANDIAIHNPIYFVQYILKGSDQTQIFKGGKPPIPLINRKGTIDEATDFNFDILGITRNGEKLNVREQVNKSIVTFQKSDKQSYNLRISRIVNQQTRSPEVIPEGTYHLELLLSIVASDSTSDAVHSRTLRVEDVSFSYKKE